MEMRRFAGLSTVLVQLALPGTLAGQVAGGVEFFGTLDSSDPVTRTMGGLSLSVGTPFVGIRGSGGLGISSVGSQGTSATGPSDLVWGTDADLMLGPLAPDDFPALYNAHRPIGDDDLRRGRPRA